MSFLTGGSLSYHPLCVSGAIEGAQRRQWKRKRKRQKKEAPGQDCFCDERLGCSSPQCQDETHIFMEEPMYSQKTPEEILGQLLGVLLRLPATCDSYGLSLAGMNCECDHQSLFGKKAGIPTLLLEQLRLRSVLDLHPDAGS